MLSRPPLDYHLEMTAATAFFHPRQLPADAPDSRDAPPTDGGDWDGGDDSDDFDGDAGGGGPVRWVTVATFFNPTQAHLARLRLEAAGIDCVILDEFMASHVFAVAVGGIKLQVPDVLAAEAHGVLAMAPDRGEEDEDGEEPTAEAGGVVGTPDHCPACGSEDLRVPKGFDRLVPVAVLLTPLLFLGASGVVVYLLALVGTAVLFAGDRTYRCRRCGHAWDAG